MPTSVSGRAVIHLPRDAAWRKLRDLDRASNYVPGVTDVVIDAANPRGVGARRTVFQPRVGHMDETVTHWIEGEGFTVRLHRGADGPPPPFAEATFRYALASGDAAGETTLATLTMTYTPRWGVLGAVLDAVFLERFVRRTTEDTALAMAHHYETDAPVTKRELAALRARQASANSIGIAV